MIKFFRKIRKKILVENRFNKYLMYAIGEIILVVIGILVALQINNWNSTRLENVEKIALVKSLQKELNENLKEFKNRKSNLRQNNLNTNKILSFSAGDNLNIPLDSIKKYIVETLTFPSSRFKASLLSSANSSGKINLLNEETKTALTSFEISVDNYARFLKTLDASFFDENWFETVLRFEALDKFHRSYLNNKTIKPHPDILNSDKELIIFLKKITTYKYFYKILNGYIIEEAWLDEIIIRLENCLKEMNTILEL